MMGKNLTILGAGESGIGAARLGAKEGYTVFVSDLGAIAPERKLLLDEYGVEYEEGGHDVARIRKSDLAIKSPGIPDKAPLVKSLVDKNIPVISEIEFAYRFITREDVKIIAVTGTNGKTTTTLLVHHLLQKAGFNAALCGNIGVSMAKTVSEGRYDYYVVEVSSFQLDGIVRFKPDVAMLLNISPDHLDRYEYDCSRYVASKFRIVENMGREGAFIYCADSELVNGEMAKRKIGASPFTISATKDARHSAYVDKDRMIFGYRWGGKKQLYTVPVSELPLIGKHNMLNSMSAIMGTLTLGVPVETVIKALGSFVNAPHRMEFVGSIGGVKFINDSKATNVDAAYSALEGVKGNIIWIAGGVDKGNKYGKIKELVQKKVKKLICLGIDNEKFGDFFGGIVPVEETQHIGRALKIALDSAEAGDVVLLSPACSSFDLFRNYEDRGDRFRAGVKELERLKKAQA